MARVLRGQTLSFGETHLKVEHQAKGAVAIDEAGRIAWVGAAQDLPARFKALPQTDYGDAIVMAGFVDAHIHFPQLRLLAAPAKDLMEWLARFTFPEEARFGDAEHAAVAAGQFLTHLFRHGTTAALAFCSVHKACAAALFTAAEQRNMALISGKTMMDRNAIPAVQDDPEQGAIDSEALYHAWHGKGRLRYAVTPRFAITSSPEQLAVSGTLLRQLPGSLMQTHLSESAGEMARVKELFPNERDYTAVYERFGLVTERSIFAHGIHLSDSECQRLHEAGATIAHCPTSNTFLGSGLMAFNHVRKSPRPVALAVATDIGGGTSYSMLATLAETYKVQMLTGYKASALELFHLATLGNAQRLRLADDIGSLTPGKFADVVVLDPHATPVLAARQALSQSLEEMIFALMMLGDDRAVRATYVAGQLVHDRDANAV
jgi:guanine deaminase